MVIYGGVIASSDKFFWTFQLLSVPSSMFFIAEPKKMGKYRNLLKKNLAA